MSSCSLSKTVLKFELPGNLIVTSRHPEIAANYSSKRVGGTDRKSSKCLPHNKLSQSEFFEISSSCQDTECPRKRQKEVSFSEVNSQRDSPKYGAPVQGFIYQQLLYY